ncbi:D-glycerate dehydrogenase [Acidothermaceae bacterium B102]|nr:D-glycerate dehydrogenase [Acidothermaceae bacterium B102]
MAAGTIAVTRWIPAEAVELLATAGRPVVSSLDRPLTHGELCAAVSGAVAVVALLHDRVDAEVLDAAGPSLRVIANVAVGYDNIDVVACHDRGVIVTNTPDVLVEATADLTLALLLAVTRRLVEGDQLLRRHESWTWSLGFMLGTGLQGKRLGLVGNGRIAQAVAVRAKAFGMDVVSTSRSGGVPLGELLATSDVVSLHCPFTPQTHHLVGAASLATMKPTAFLVNTARGPVVDEEALADALERRVIAGAALDVFEFEPQVSERLLASDRVVLTPHLGSATTETRTAMAVLAARNVVDVLAGGRGITPIR